MYKTKIVSKKKPFFTILLFLLCLTANFSGAAIIPVRAAISDADKAQLQIELQQLDKQIAGYEQELQGTRNEKNTLSNKIKQLKTEQSKLQAQVQQTNLLLGNIDTQITDTEDSINQTQNRSAVLKAQIAETIFSLYQKDSTTMISSLAAKDGLSGFFIEVDNTQKLSENLSNQLDEVKKLQQDLERQSAQLEDQQQSAKEMLSIKALQSDDLVSKLGEQGSLLADTQGKEAQYNQILAITKKRASEIRNQIYDLVGFNREVTFGEAMDIAVGVSKQTGVRAAFLLAILTQESSLGKNVGTCNRAGDPGTKSWRVIMKPDRDQKPFVAITADLGLDIDTTAVSCPMRGKNGAQIGWGGAMGPAQFIPSTWMGYKNQIANITGKTANPWDIRDAFIAAALLLKNNGAVSGGDGEWKAAMRYFSGSTNTQYRFYGDNVIATAKKYQTNIDALGN